MKTPDEQMKAYVNDYIKTLVNHVKAEEKQIPITPQINDLWKHGSEYCFCYTGPRGEDRMIYGDGATVPVMDYVIDGNAGYYLAWRGDGQK